MTLVYNKTLQSLNLKGNHLEDSDLGLLVSGIEFNQSLLSLNLQKCNIDREGVKKLACILNETNLTSLNLGANPKIGPIGIEHIGVALGNNSKLLSINLDGVNPSGSGLDFLVKSLKENTNLESLSLRENKIDDLGAISLAEVLSNHPSIKFVDLSDNQIGELGAEALAKALEKNNKILSFNIAFNEIGDYGAQAFGRMLEKNNTLTSLNLSGTEINERILNIIVGGLKKNKSLTALNLGENSFSNEDAAYLAHLLKHNSTLLSLDLRDNEIGTEGIIKLVEALKKNKSLISIDLGSNSLGDKKLEELIKFFQYNTTLASINLENNNLSNAGIDFLIAALENNFTITSINLSNNSISKDQLESVVALLQRNCDILEISAMNEISWNIEEKLNHLVEEIKPKITLESDTKLSRVSFQTKPSHIENEINAIIGALKSFYKTHSQTMIRQNIQHAVELLIMEYYPQPNNNETDFKNMLNLFLLLPSLEDEFENIFFCCIEQYSLLVQERITSQKDNLTSIPDFAPLSYKLPVIRDRIDSIYSKLSSSEAEFFNRLKNQLIIRNMTNQPKFFNNVNNVNNVNKIEQKLNAEDESNKINNLKMNQ